MSSNDVTCAEVGMTRADDIPIITIATFSSKFWTYFLIFVGMVSVTSSVTMSVLVEVSITADKQSFSVFSLKLKRNIEGFYQFK